MAAATDPLTTLAESVADGESIDWDALDALAADPELRGLVEHLRVVAGVAEVHRSQVDESDVAPSTPHIVDAADDDRERWGHLALVRKLGQGAFGEVYLAHDTWLDHPRALKLLKPEVANRLSPEQLLHEARKLVRVRHPSVVAVHGADRHEGRVGFWMDYVDGQTLAEQIDEASLEADEATAIGRDLCAALAAVHHAGLIHRDIKAQNVMRAADGRIFLMDFGAGEFIGASPTGRPQGTPLYLAPELFEGGAASVQSDIYAVGVLLYHLVTGTFPVQAGSVTELIHAHTAGAGVSLRTLHPELPERLVAAVDRALDPDPARRFASADEMREALTEPASLTSSQVIEIVRVEETAASRLWAHALRALIALVVSAGVVGVAGFLSWRSFQIALHVDAAFAPPPAEYVRLGLRATFPFAVYWALSAAGFALARGLDLVAGGPVARFVEVRTTALSAAATIRLAVGLCLLAAMAWVLLIATHWRLWEILSGLQIGTAGVSTEGLGPSFRIVNRSYGNLAGWLTGGLIAMALYVFPALERQRPDRGGIRMFSWTAAVLAVLILCSAMLTRGLAWERYPIVTYENRRSYVIATNGDDMALYAPSHPQLGSLRVRRGDSRVVDTGTVGLLVDQ